jgi:uncharacterized protein with von Willebrand factor type A (vWA) domain
VPLSALEAFVQALGVSPPGDKRSLYWLARVTLVHRHSDLAVFDKVFDAVFSDATFAVDPPSRRALTGSDAHDTLAPVPGEAGVEQDGAGLPWSTLPRRVEAAGEDADGPLLPDLLGSAVERFADTPFEQLDEDQLSQLGTWLEQSSRRWPMRQSRREQLHRHGRRVAMRQTLTRSRRTGWEPIELSRQRPVQRPRRLVMLSDVSQSMQSYSTAYLHLMRAFARSGRAETFAFSTSLTRLTPSLVHRSAEVAMSQATARVVDRYGGTHLASSLRELLNSRHGNAMRGGVLVIASDGWDSDEPEQLAVAMARARRRAYRVIWLNPRAASPGFAPLVGSMAAALPFCDDFLPAHSTRALGDVLNAIAGVRTPIGSRG